MTDRGTPTPKDVAESSSRAVYAANRRFEIGVFGGVPERDRRLGHVTFPPDKVDVLAEIVLDRTTGTIEYRSPEGPNVAETSSHPDPVE